MTATSRTAPTYRILGYNIDVGVIRITSPDWGEPKDLVVFPSSPIAAYVQRGASKAVFVSKDAKIAKVDLSTATIVRRGDLSQSPSRLLLRSDGSVVGLNGRSVQHIDGETLAETRYDVALNQDGVTATLHAYAEIGPPLEEKARRERDGWTDDHRPKEWQWAHNPRSWPVHSGPSFAFPYDVDTATLDARGRVVAVFDKSGVPHPGRDTVLSGIGVVRFDLDQRVLTSTVIAGFDGQARMHGTRRAVAVSEDATGLLIDRAHIRRQVEPAPRRLFGKRDPDRVRFEFDLEYWQLGDGEQSPEFVGFMPVMTRPLAAPEDLSERLQPFEAELDRLLAEDPLGLQRLLDAQGPAYRTYPSEPAKRRDGLDGRVRSLRESVLAYHWPDGAQLPLALQRDGGMRALRIGELGPRRPVSGLESFAGSHHVRAQIETAPDGNALLIHASDTTASVMRIWLRLEQSVLQGLSSGSGPLPTDTTLTDAQFRAEHDLATLLAKQHRPGNIRIPSLATEDLIAGVAALTAAYAAHHAEIVIGARWDAGLTHPDGTLDEIAWSRHIAAAGDTSAIPVLDNFLRTVMEVAATDQSGQPKPIPVSPAQGSVHWDVWLPDDSPQLGMATANALIRLSGSVPARALTFYRHHDFEHDMFTGDEGLRLDIVPHLPLSAPGLLRLYAVVGLQLMCTGRVGPDMFAEHGAREIASGLAEGVLGADAVAQIVCDEAAALQGNLSWGSNAGPDGLLHAVADGMDDSVAWQAEFARALRRRLPKAA